MESLINWIHRNLGFSPELQHHLIVSALTIILVFLARLVILRIVLKRVTDDRNRYNWRNTTSYIAYIFVVIMVGRVWFVGFHSLSTFLGLITAGLAIALQVPIVNFAGWLFIIWRRPFEVSDRIEIAQVRGDVIDQRIFMFTMMEIGNWVHADQSTGRIIHMPNGKVFQEFIGNYSKGFHYIWNEIPILITFESNWQKAERLLIAIVNQHAEHLTKRAKKRVEEAARKYLIIYTKLTPIVYLSVTDNGVMLTLRYLCDPRQRRGGEDAIWRDVLNAFAKEEDIDFAYPTQRFYHNQLEGKCNAGGPAKPDTTSPKVVNLH